MEPALKTGLWQQFGATIDMLDNALRACPDELWRNRLWEGLHPAGPDSEFWYLAYHTLFWLDLYLSGGVDGFAPPPPFTLDELDPAGLFPERPYTHAELQAYLAHCRQKCRTVIESLTEADAHRMCRFAWNELSFFELLLYNLRHVQEHAAQLNLLLGQRLGSAPGWVAKARSRAA
jgi:hypothetical protein